MNGKFLLAGTIAGGLVIFIWGAASHMVIPWPGEPLKEFTDPQPLLEMIRAHTPGNGVYLDLRGVFASVNLRPDLSDQSDLFGSRMAIQLGIEMLVGLLLSLVVLKSGVRSATGAAGLAALAALAAGIEQLIPEWNWYGFSTSYVVSELADLVIGWSLAGLLLGSLARRMKLA